MTLKSSHMELLLIEFSTISALFPHLTTGWHYLRSLPKMMTLSEKNAMNWHVSGTQSLAHLTTSALAIIASSQIMTRHFAFSLPDKSSMPFETHSIRWYSEGVWSLSVPFYRMEAESLRCQSKWRIWSKCWSSLDWCIFSFRVLFFPILSDHPRRYTNRDQFHALHPLPRCRLLATGCSAWHLPFK